MTELPVIVTERLRLRVLREADLAHFAELADHPLIYATTLRIARPYRVEEARRFMQFQRDAWCSGDALQLAVALRDSDAVVGACGLELKSSMQKAELGFWVGVPHWNRGYATEAAAALVGYGFQELGLNRIWAGHFKGNDASSRVQQKLGMKHEGVLRRSLLKDGRFHDDVVYAVLREEFTPLVEWKIENKEGRECR